MLKMTLMHTHTHKDIKHVALILCVCGCVCVCYSNASLNLHTHWSRKDNSLCTRLRAVILAKNVVYFRCRAIFYHNIIRSKTSGTASKSSTKENDERTTAGCHIKCDFLQWTGRKENSHRVADTFDGLGGTQIHSPLRPAKRRPNIFVTFL